MALALRPMPWFGTRELGQVQERSIKVSLLEVLQGVSFVCEPVRAEPTDKLICAHVHHTTRPSASI